MTPTKEILDAVERFLNEDGSCIKLRQPCIDCPLYADSHPSFVCGLDYAIDARRTGPNHVPNLSARRLKLEFAKNFLIENGRLEAVMKKLL